MARAMVTFRVVCIAQLFNLGEGWATSRGPTLWRGPQAVELKFLAHGGS